MKYDQLLDRIYNAKFKQAYERARDVDDIPRAALRLVDFMGRKYGDIGYNNGEVGREMRQLSNVLVEILGYEYDEEVDDYKPIGW